MGLRDLAGSTFDSRRLHQTSPRLRLASHHSHGIRASFLRNHEAKSARRSLGVGGWQLPSPQLSNMKYVYLIQSILYPDRKYIGVTQDLKTRLKSHNEGQSPHTSNFKPWKLVTYIAFSNESKAVAFEKYLKSGSGRAFANKRL
jgi:putative endonuclease